MNGVIGLGFERQNPGIQNYFHCGIGNEDENNQSVKKVNDCCNDRKVRLNFGKEHESSRFVNSCNRQRRINSGNLFLRPSFTYNPLYALAHPVTSLPPPESTRTVIFLRNCVFLI